MADYRIDQLNAAPGAPAPTDIIEGERDPAGTPSSEKLTWDQVATSTAFTSRFLEADALSAHAIDTTGVHGIVDTNQLLTDSDIGVTIQPFDPVLSGTTASFTTTKDSKLTGIETGATADQTNAEIETAYNAQVAVVSQAEAEAGTLTTVRRWTPQRVAQAIAALAPSGGGGGGGTSSTYVIVASVDAPTAVKNAADYVCDGTADQVQINSAILEAAGLTANGGSGGASALQRGTVLLTGGKFVCSGSVLGRTAVTLMGCGMLTELRASSITTSTGSGTPVALIKLNTDDVHLFRVSDMYLNGNASAGGANCHGIYFDNGAADLSEYPTTDPDPDNSIHNLYIRNFTGGGGTRHAVYVTDDSRGFQASDLNIRVTSGHAIFISGAPDGHLNNIHIGGATGDGVLIDGGNYKVNNIKTYYCDGTGFNFNNARMVGACIEAQDCGNGVRFGQSDVAVAGILIDTCDVNGLEIAANRVHAEAVAILCRPSPAGRYANTNVGVLFTGSPTDCFVTASVNPTGMTATRTGTAGSRSFVRVADGSTLYSVG